MRVVYTARALRQLREIHAYFSKENKAAAANVIYRIANLTALFGQSPKIGRPTDEPGVRVMNVQPYPYLVFYGVDERSQEIRIIRIRHMARHR
jgi:addiction module RelE/StbE family toxin